MFACPRCDVPLQPLRKKGLCIWGCGGCQGRLATVSTLRRVLDPGFVYRLWSSAREGNVPSGRACPGCRLRMRSSAPELDGSSEHVDACLGCQFVWFDADELERSPERKSEPAPKAGSLSPAAREAAVRLELGVLRQRAGLALASAEPDAPWKRVVAMFGVPVEIDGAGPAERPWLTWFLACACVAVSLSLWLGAWPSEAEGLDALGVFAPQSFFERKAYPFLFFVRALTSFCTHASALHLAFNLYFLLAFGPVVEEALGRTRFALLLLLATLSGALLHLTTTAQPEHPLIGASAGIAGILAWFALAFPRVRLGLHLWAWRVPPSASTAWLDLPAWAWFLVWFALQFLGAWQLEEELSHVAHLGGALAGLLWWALPRMFALHGIDPNVD